MFNQDDIPKKISQLFADAAKKLTQNRAYVLREFARKVKRIAGKVPFVEDAVALYFCALDRETPLQAKAVAFAALAYLILPEDFIPDFVPLLGFTDDATAIAIAVRTLTRWLRPSHRERARRWLDGGPREGKEAIDVEYEIVE